jgi:hypothetical protein
MTCQLFSIKLSATRQKLSLANKLVVGCHVPTNWRIIVIEYNYYKDCCNDTTMLYRLLFVQGKAYWLVFKFTLFRVEQFGSYI